MNPRTSKLSIALKGSLQVISVYLFIEEAPVIAVVVNSVYKFGFCWGNYRYLLEMLIFIGIM